MSMTNVSKIYAQSSIDEAIEKWKELQAGTSDTGGIIDTIISFAIPLSGVCVFILLAFATFKLMTSRGDPEKLKEARDQITNAIIGFIFILLSVTILVLLGNIFNIGGIEP